LNSIRPSLLRDLDADRNAPKFHLNRNSIALLYMEIH
jgi:hypothetical protein